MFTRRNAVKMLSGAGASLALTPLAPGLPSAFADSHISPILALAKQVAAGGDVKELTILLPRGSEANVKPVMDVFSAAVGLPMRLVFTNVDEINTRILTDTLIGANSFDIALPATFGLPDLVDANALSPLDDLEEKYSSAIGMNASLYTVGDRFLGKTYGFQTDGDVYLMFYRKSWLEDPKEQARFLKENSTPLRVARNWAELDLQIAHFHQPENGKFGGALFRSPIYLIWEWWVRLHANGSWPVDDNFKPLVNSPAGVAALEAIIATQKNLYPEALTNGPVANWKAFAEGNMFCNIGWGGSQKFFHRAGSPIRNDLVFAPPPGIVADGIETPMPYFNWGWNYTVARQSKAREIAYLFARFAVSGEMSTKAIRGSNGFFDPFRPEHYADPEIRKTYSDDFLTVHRKSMETAIPDFHVRGKGEYFEALRTNLDLAARGVLSAGEALNVAAAQWSQITNKLGPAEQARQWRSIKAEYPAPIRKLLS